MAAHLDLPDVVTGANGKAGQIGPSMVVSGDREAVGQKVLFMLVACFRDWTPVDHGLHISRRLLD